MYFLLFILGLVVGSFLNVVILRYNPEFDRGFFNLPDLGGRSRCMSCGKTLGFFELIPVFSFLFQRGKCRECKATLSWQYPLIELASAAIFSGIPFFLINFYGFQNIAPIFHFPFSIFYFLIALWVAVFLVLLLIAIIDFRHYIIPNGLNMTLALLGVAITAFTAFYKNNLPFAHESFLTHYSLIFSLVQNIWLNHLFGSLIAGLFFGLFSLLSGGRAMGWGDTKFAFAAGLVLGWPDIALAIIFSFIFGGIAGAILLLKRKKTMKDKLPFGPFFVLGLALTVLAGYQAMAGYFWIFL